MSTSTQSATSSGETYTPWIPPELFYLILEHLWEEPHTSHSRSALLKSIVLVNRTWLAIAARLASRDAHPSSHRNPRTFLRLITQTSPAEGPRDLFSAEISCVATQSCRSLTFDVDGRPQWPLFNNDGPMGVGLGLKLASVPNRLPNLRHISISHTDWSHGHVFQNLRLWGFPPQVTRLSLDYTFTALSKDLLKPFDIASVLSWIYRPNLGPRKAFIPGLRHVALSGVPKPFPGLLLQHVCPNVETLELSRPAEGQLSALAPLPPAVRTLVLCYPGVALSKKQMAAWTVPEALKTELFPPSGAEGEKLKPARIVIRSGTPEPVSFIELWRERKRFNVELVYERDHSRGPVVPQDARPEAESAYRDPLPGALDIIRGWM